MEFIRVTLENIDKEHICCAISNDRDCQVISKKEWLRERLAEGLVFLKADARGKCFIEYLPAECAWAPVCADGYMYIDCFWVSGQMKGQGYANKLLEECIRDSREKGKKGLCVLSSPKKKSFLSDPGYLKHKGFQVADSAQPYFDLLYLPFTENVEKPCFKPQVKLPQIQERGWVLYYTKQCPFTAKYVPLLEKTAEESGILLKTILINDRETAQSAPVAATSFALFKDGEYVTNEILSVKKFLSLCQE